MKDDDDDRRKVQGARAAARRPCEECQACGCPPYCLLNALFLHTPYRGKVFCRPNWRGHMYHHPFQICSKPIQFKRVTSIFVGNYYG